MKLQETCFKIDKPNAQAMIKGFHKNGKLHRQSIWLAVKLLPFPALLTLQRSPTRFKVSEVGKRMESNKFKMPLKYVATLVSEYFIRNNINLWKTLCSNDLFDIWKPSEPYRRFTQANSHPKNFRIQLLRIYEINYEYSLSDINFASSRIDRLVVPNRNVKAIRPVISDSVFNKLLKNLENSVSAYLIRPKRRVATLHTNLPVACDVEEPPKRFKSEVTRVVRDSKKSVSLKKDYDYYCQVCNVRLKCGPEKYYIEAHHIRPLGGTHKGHDNQSNMLVLCPNCHALFDHGVPKFIDSRKVKIYGRSLLFLNL